MNVPAAPQTEDIQRKPNSAETTAVSMQDIQKLANRIARQFRPERILLFGPYAYGKPGPDSDVDLLVVMNTTLTSREQRLEISRVLSPRPFPLDILVRTPQDLEKRHNLGDRFLQEIIDRGKVIYERPRH
jgi:predicted nucleotidyltransferase